MMRNLLPPLAAALLLLALWQAGCRLFAPNPLILPAPSDVLGALWYDRKAIGPHALATVLVAGFGFALSVGFALAASVWLYHCRLAERMVLPLLIASQTVPLIALAPLMILWFGFGWLPKILLVILVTFLPVLLNLLAGYRDSPQVLRDLLRSMGAGRGQIFRRVVLPAAGPQFLAGLKIAGTYAIVAAIFAEYAGARQGLGIYILQAKNNFRADQVLAAVVVSATLTLLLQALIAASPRLLRRGRPGGLQ